MILRNHSYLKAYKCWRIFPILKTSTIKWLAIFFKKYFNFEGFYIVYIIIWWFLGWKKFTQSKLGETRLQKMQNWESFFGEKPLNIAHGINFAPKIIFGSSTCEIGKIKIFLSTWWEFGVDHFYFWALKLLGPIMIFRWWASMLWWT